ncbi:MAG: hypothetical protein E7587_07365 [Ruminococcaceae bacterium]|nr:hypothetical protein [Oscillospiraceae bacterium]
MKRIAYIGEKNDFYRYISLSFDGEISEYSDMETAGADALEKGYDAIIATAPRNSMLPSLSYGGMKCYAELYRRGVRVYAESYDAGDYNSAMLFGFVSESCERAFYDENLVWNGKLLQIRGKGYVPGRLRGDAVATVTAEDCVGSHTPVVPSTRKFPVVVKNGSFTFSAIRLSEFDRLTMLPHSRFCELYSDIFSFVLGEEKGKCSDAFCHVWKKQALAGGTNTVREAVSRAVNWHFSSGLIPDVSGDRGCYEMIRSHDLSLRCNHRVDVILLSAALFCTAGKYMKSDSIYECGKNLAELCFKHNLQETEGDNKGIFHWYESFGLDQKTCYTSDNGRDGMAMLQLYRTTGDVRYLDSLKALGEAYLCWTENTPYFKSTSFSLSHNTLKSIGFPKTPPDAPVFYEGMAIVLANLYRITGDERYRSSLKLTSDALYKKYPDYSLGFSPLTKNFLYSRLLTVLSAAHEIGCGDYSELINTMLDFFEALQTECGGVKESGLIMTDGTLKHPEFSVSMGEEYDSITDILYCINNLLGCFSLIGSMNNSCGVNKEKAEKMRKKLVRFILDIQLAEEDPRLNGGWMRAFDMETDSYFGVNKDKDWGAYCIMGGWIMGFVPLLLMAEEGAVSIYSIVEKAEK